jgi:hypothetical protein
MFDSVYVVDNKAIVKCLVELSNWIRKSPSVIQQLSCLPFDPRFDDDGFLKAIESIARLSSERRESGRPRVVRF